MNLSKLASPLKSLSLIALTLSLSVAVQTSALSTWVPATASAPGGNVSTPLNTGLNTQSKLGGLFLNTSNTQPFDIGLSVFGKTVLNGDVVIATGSPAAGKVLTALDTNGTVGWGTVTGGTGGGTTPAGTCDTSPFQQDLGVLQSVHQNTSGTQLIVVAKDNFSLNSSGYVKGYISPTNSFAESDIVSEDTYVNSGNAWPYFGSVTFVVPPGYYYKVSSTASLINAQAWKVCGGGGSGSSFSNVRVFNSSGIFTVPTGVTKVMVEAWGGGGGGAAGPDSTNSCASGGAGGGYGKSIIDVTPGANITVTVGAGGAGGTGTSNSTIPGGNGGTSSFGSSLNATGGVGASIGYGDSASPASTAATGGSSNASIVVSGQNGGIATICSSGFGYNAGNGGDGGNGGSGGFYGNPGQDGKAPGGGGGAGFACGQSYCPGDPAGGSGASGRVIVWY